LCYKGAVGRRPAISEIVATILVIAMTVVAGGVLYTYFSATVTKAEVTSQIQVSANLAVPSGQGQGTIAITVVNSGSVAVTGLAVSGSIVPSGVVWNLPPSLGNPIPPGGGTSTAVFPTKTSVTAGVSYALVGTATFANGGTTSQVVTVTATS
jgi:flagellin-like protein